MPFIIKNGKYYGSSADGSIDITQAEYDELKASGQVNPSVTYYITDGVYEDESNSGSTNNASAISCVDVDGNQSTVQNEIDKNRDDINELNLNFRNHTSVILQKSPGENINHTIPEDGLYLLYARNYGANIYVNIYINDVRTCVNASIESGSAFTMTCKTLQKNDVVKFLCDQGWYEVPYSEIGIIKLL